MKQDLMRPLICCTMAAVCRVNDVNNQTNVLIESYKRVKKVEES